MQPHRRAIGVLSIAVAASAALAVAPVDHGAAAAPAFCAVGATYHGTTITWTGSGDGDSWTDADNWSPRTVPDAHQVAATYQKQYVCIGTVKGGKPASVVIAGTSSFHIAGIDVGQRAGLSIEPGGRLFLGSAKGTATVASSVDARSAIELDAATLGGNGPLTIRGTLLWTGRLKAKHREVATQTSSECAFDPTITACPGDTSPGGGRTDVARGGRLLVNGTGFGGVDLADGRLIDNSGTIRFSHDGYLTMSNGTTLIDEAHSRLQFNGEGGIFRGSTRGRGAPVIRQAGAISRHGVSTEGAVVGVPLRWPKRPPAVSVQTGQLILDGTKAPKAAAGRGTRYGLGTCGHVTLTVCLHPIADRDQPQTAVIGTSSEAAAPRISTVAVSLGKAPAKMRGHRVVGRAITVTAPKKKTSHSTHLSFGYDVTTAGLSAGMKPIVYRGTHAIQLCSVHGLTATNTSCVVSAGVAHSGTGVKGDLTVVVISIQPDARWLVAR
jgi:hypothetical protein